MDKEPELSENKFINESYQKDPTPFWLWLGVIFALVVLLWGSESWFKSFVSKNLAVNSWSKVTNREIVLFLYDNPEFMRIHSKGKSSYLPGFYYKGRGGMDPSEADVYALGSPELFFRYHTWDRLLSSYAFERKVTPEMFNIFINDAREWHPDFWKDAPEDYKQLVASFDPKGGENLYSKLPILVRRAFVGWLNFYYEGDAIDNYRPKAAEVRTLLTQYPHYTRNYWQNILKSEGEPSPYLQDLASKRDDEEISDEELSPFTKAALYNLANKGS